MDKRILLFIALTLGTGFPEISNGQTILNIQPIQVFSVTSQAANPSRTLYLDYLTAIWGQAGITINILPWHTFTDGGLFYQYDTDPFGASNAFGNPQNYGGLPLSSNTIIMWFVHTIADSSGGGYGFSKQGGNGVMISDAVFSANRYDTISHEIGHNLGLDHTAFGAGPADNLMSSSRTIPTSLSMVGSSSDVLLPAQQAQAFSVGTSLGLLTSVPEPSDFGAIMGFVAMGWVFIKRRLAEPKGSRIDS